jgi:hypothetical protein
MRKATILNAGLACLVILAAGCDALAKPRYRVSSEPRYRSRGPIEVERRSWLDPGTKVPVGSTNRYMVQQTYLNQDPIQTYQPSWYMGETLPQRMPQNVIVPYNEGLELDWP